MERRTLLTAAGTLSLAAVAPRLGTGTALAAGEMPKMQVVGAQRRRVGDMVVTALSDGFIQLGPDAVPNGTAEELKPLFDSAFLEIDKYRGAVNAYLVDMPDRRVLIDAGGETAGFPTLGRLDENLKAIGVEPGSIDALVATHLHPDHVGGAVDAEGKSAFPNAQLVVRAEEASFWRDDANMNDGNKNFFQLARTVLDAYGDARTTLFDGDVEVLPGMMAQFLPGHTPGHTGYMLDSGGEQLLVWGDIVHIPPVQFAQPKYYVGFDVNPEQAVETRRKVMERAMSDRTKVAGMHHLFPGFGNVAAGAEGEEYRFVEAPFEYEL